jgi:hypothetical protein
VKNKLIKYLRILSKSNFTNEKHEEILLNVANHFSGNHKLCIHNPYTTHREEKIALGEWENGENEINVTLINAFTVFLNYTTHCVAHVSTNYRTRTN